MHSLSHKSALYSFHDLKFYTICHHLMLQKNTFDTVMNRHHSNSSTNMVDWVVLHMLLLCVGQMLFEYQGSCQSYIWVDIHVKRTFLKNSYYNHCLAQSAALTFHLTCHKTFVISVEISDCIHVKPFRIFYEHWQRYIIFVY